MSALGKIRQIDYTIIRARDMKAMRHFYVTVMEFPLENVLFDGRWVEYRVGSNTLALAENPPRHFNPAPFAEGTVSVHLAFRVAPESVAQCAAELEKKGVTPISPVTDQAFGHRTVFYRDPDGNAVEIYAQLRDY